jgi:hypothetical protein
VSAFEKIISAVTIKQIMLRIRPSQEDQEFKTNLGYIVRPCVKKCVYIYVGSGFNHKGGFVLCQLS